jgi:hypothetical protein
MGVTRHERSFIDFERPYEQNIVGLKGIIYFGLGLFILIVITFALMWALLRVFADRAAENAPPSHPLALSEQERLPPEPRLQLAPGFKIETYRGPINLELLEPGAEFREFHQEALLLWKNGQKDKTTGAVAVLPIEEAKQRLLEKALKANTDPNALTLFENSRLYYSDASSGRIASEKRR